MPVPIVTAAVITIVIIGVVLIVQMFFMTAMLLSIRNLTQELRENIDPILARTNSLVATATETVELLQKRTGHIADQAAHTSDVVSDRVEKTTDLVQKIISVPLIGGFAGIAGLFRGLQTWQTLRAQRRHAAPTAEPEMPITPRN